MRFKLRPVPVHGKSPAPNAKEKGRRTIRTASLLRRKTVPEDRLRPWQFRSSRFRRQEGGRSRPHGAKIPRVVCRDRQREPSSQATASRPAPSPPVVEIACAGIFAREYAVSYIHSLIPVNTEIVTFDFRIERICAEICFHKGVFTKTPAVAEPQCFCSAKRRRRDCCRGAFIISNRWRPGSWVRVLAGNFSSARSARRPGPPAGCR